MTLVFFRAPSEAGPELKIRAPGELAGVTKAIKNLPQSAPRDYSIILTMTPDQYCQEKAIQSGSSFYYSFLYLPLGETPCHYGPLCILP